MGQVGAVFALEVSRTGAFEFGLASIAGAVGALTDTLVIDEDGCYNPADFNDGLLLGLKGTMAQAELHLFARAPPWWPSSIKQGKASCVFRFRSGSATTKRVILFWTRIQEVQGGRGLGVSSFSRDRHCLRCGAALCKGRVTLSQAILRWGVEMAS